MNKVTKVLGGVFVALLLLLAGGELVVRFSGVTDFPVYLADDQIGYILKPDQRGSFLNHNDWVFNEKSQGTTTWKPNGARDLLLLGDSLVLGGNPINQPDKLGPRLEKNLPGWRVWPASAGSWSIANEMAYLDRFPEVAKEWDALVWVVNTGDLDGPSRWKLEETHPRSRPRSALAYVFSKYVLLPYFRSKGPTESRPPGMPYAAATEASLRERYAQLRSQHPGQPILFVVSPAKSEVGETAPEAEAIYREFVRRLRAVLGPTGEILEVRDDSRWKAAFYRDGIHPTAEGYATLSEIIADRLRARLTAPSAARP